MIPLYNIPALVEEYKKMDWYLMSRRGSVFIPRHQISLRIICRGHRPTPQEWN